MHKDEESKSCEEILAYLLSYVYLNWLIFRIFRMALVSKNCQSCGMPLKRDAQGGGTNTDGSRSTLYCSHCYLEGRFTLPNLKVEDMQLRVKHKMKDMGMPGLVAGFYTRSIPKLQRWRKG